MESSCDGGALSNTIDLWKLKLDGSMEDKNDKDAVEKAMESNKFQREP